MAAAGDMTITAAPPSEIWLALPAVIVPSLRTPASRQRETTWSSPAGPPRRSRPRSGRPGAGGCYRDHLSANLPVLDGGRRPLVGGSGEGVLALPGDHGFVGPVVLGAGPHVDLVEGVPAGRRHHGVDELGVAHPVSGPGAGQQVGRVGHGLHAAGDHDVGVAGVDQQVGQVDGVEAGEAHLVDGGAGTVMGIPALTAAWRAVIWP